MRATAACLDRPEAGPAAAFTLIVEPRREPVGGQRAREVVALAGLAVELAELLDGLVRLDALGDDVDREVPGEAQDGLHDRAVVRVGGHALHEPQVDLVASYTSQGLAGTETPAAINPATGLSRVPPNLVGGYVSSLGNLIAQDYPTYRVGVSISLPWGNTTAKADLGRTLVEGTKIGNQRAQTEQVIEAEVRNAVQAIRSAEALLASAVAARIADEQLAESEQRQFRGGATTFFVVRQRLTDLAVARALELRARADLNKAISAFNRSVGATLTANNVAVSK